VLRYNTKIKIENLRKIRPLKSEKEASYSIGDYKIGIDYLQPDDIPYDLLFVIGIFDSDDEEGGTIEYKAQAVSALDNKRQRPQEEAVFAIAKESIEKLNDEFHRGSANLGFGYSEHIFPIEDEKLRQQITDKLNQFFPPSH
jgi:hypothetical protein